MKVLLTTAVLSAFILASCASGSSEKEYVSTATAAPVTGTDTLSKKNADAIEQLLGANAAKPAAVQVPVTVPATNGQPASVPVAVNATPVATPTTAAGINPAHGQPGHRCDIAVGAPLSAAPAVQNVVQPVTQPAVKPLTINKMPTTAVPTPAPAVPTAKGMNPPHGQPGHRCDIAVGAPLNSKPAAPAPAPQAQATPLPVTVNPNAPTIIPSEVKAAPTAAGMNPAHGQPGHRCDIAVGAPLNSKPTAKKDSAK
jgi:hypothetical protein